MIGFVRRTVSPWSSSMRRSTPWVLGCCGPMLMIMVSSSLTSTSTSSCDTPRSTAPCSRARTASPVSLRGLISWAPSSVSVVSSVIRSPRPRRFFELHGDPADEIVLAEGVALPIVGHEDARQIGVALEHDAEHVVHLALHGLGAGEHLEQRRERRLSLGHLSANANALALLHVHQTDDDLETLGRHSHRQRAVDGDEVV